MFNRETGVIVVKNLTPLGVIGEISRLRKNRYSHIDRSFFDRICVISQDLELEEVFDDLPTFGVLLVEELGMKLQAVKPASFLLHRLDRTRLV